VTLVLCHGLLFGQEEHKEEKKISVSPFTAQFLISTDTRTICFNFVGTGIRYTHKNTIISISLFPTLTFREDEHLDPTEPKKPFVRPTFALGPLVQYKRLMVGFPSYYQDDEWHFSAGLGVRIGKLEQGGNGRN